MQPAHDQNAEFGHEGHTNHSDIKSTPHPAQTWQKPELRKYGQVGALTEAATNPNPTDGTVFTS